jgi:hypothetical protein
MKTPIEHLADPANRDENGRLPFTLKNVAAVGIVMTRAYGRYIKLMNLRKSLKETHRQAAVKAQEQSRDASIKVLGELTFFMGDYNSEYICHLQDLARIRAQTAREHLLCLLAL